MNAQFYFDTGMMFIEKRKYEEAISCFEESIKLNPEFSDAYLGIGACKIQLGDTENGEKAILKSAHLGNIQARQYIDTKNFAIEHSENSIEFESYDKTMASKTVAARRSDEENNTEAHINTLKTKIAHNLNISFATRWPRFFARTFDIWWETLFIALVFGIVLGYYSTGFVVWIHNPWAEQVFWMFCLPAGLMLDAVLYNILGNTPGKSLLGLKVYALDNRILNFRQYLARNYSMWIKGLAFGLPLVTVGIMLYQFSRLGKGQQASYDECSGYRVRAKPIGILRKIGFGLAFFGCFLTMTILNSIETSTNRDIAPNSTSKIYYWNNPTTHVNTKIDAQWKYSEQTNSIGQQISVFSEQTDHSVVVFAVENITGYTLRDYVAAFQKNSAATMQFSGNGNFFEKDGRQTWQGSGFMVEKTDNRLKLQITQIGHAFWRVVTVQAMPYDYTERLVAQLQTALWSTVR